MTTITFGTHNLHDAQGQPTPFADIVLFAEVAPEKLLSVFSRIRGYELIVCKQQRDLAIAYKRKVFEPEEAYYRLAHVGLTKVTPSRGTFALAGRLLGNAAVITNEHRINAAFPPYVRGEASLRKLCWETHTTSTIAWHREWFKQGRWILAGGDDNAPKDVSAYRGTLAEVGGGYDRLAATKTKGLQLHSPKYLGRAGSDHPRLRATLEVRPS